jgi:hypothetical protein
MKELTASARQCLDNYLEKVRTRLSGAKSLDAAEIERDIIEHIERELEQASEPVEFGQVEEVLDRLGAPEQWVPDDELSWSRKIIVRMQSGPDDWRLAYICLGLFILGLIILPIGILFLIPLSFYIARSAISTAGGIDKLGRQKLLLYPVLIFIYAILAFSLLIGPGYIIFIFVVPTIGSLIDDFGSALENLNTWWLRWIITLFASGIWWIILGAVLIPFNFNFYKFIFKPFLDKVSKKKIAIIVTLVGLFLILAAVGLLFGFNSSHGIINFFKQLYLM